MRSCQISSQKIFIQTISLNLAIDGWIFLHLIDKSDMIVKSNLDKQIIKELFKDFIIVSIYQFMMYDQSYHHYHHILEVIARKRS